MKNRILYKLLLVVALAFLIGSCTKKEEQEEIVYSAEAEQELLSEYLEYIISEGYDIDTTANGVYYVVIEEGDGDTVSPGDDVSVSYNGYFIGGSSFDSSGDPQIYGYYTYTHIEDPMISGWEEGIETIKEGGTSLLIVPSDMGYGSTGMYTIPPYTTLLYEIYVHEIVSAEE